MTVPLHVELFPQSSVAIQVRVKLYVPAQEPGVVLSVNVITTSTSHSSVAEGAVNTGPDGQLIGVGCETHVIVGAVMS